jgi:hypothetical protein
MPHGEGDNGVGFSYRDPAGSALEVTDEGTNPMKTHRQTLHVAKHARTVPAEGPNGSSRNVPLVRATRGILILAFALGSLGTDVAISSGYGTADHVNGHPSAGNVHLTASVSTAVSTTHVTNRPWIY